MKTSITILITLALSACVPADGDYGTLGEGETGGDMFRTVASVCIDMTTGECRIDLVGDCEAHEEDACSVEQQPRACYTPGATCYAVGEWGECNTGDTDACTLMW